MKCILRSIALLPILLIFTHTTAKATACNFAEIIYSDHDTIVNQCYRQVPFSPESRDYLIQQIRQYLDTSLLADHYDVKNNWRNQLNLLGEKTFANDYDMLHEFANIFKSFKDRHFSLEFPSCYRSYNQAIPLEMKAELVYRNHPHFNLISNRKKQILTLS